MLYRKNEGEPNIFDEPILKEIARAKGKSIAQVGKCFTRNSTSKTRSYTVYVTVILQYVIMYVTVILCYHEFCTFIGYINLLIIYDLY